MVLDTELRDRITIDDTNLATGYRFSFLFYLRLLWFATAIDLWLATSFYQIYWSWVELWFTATIDDGYGSRVELWLTAAFYLWLATAIHQIYISGEALGFTAALDYYHRARDKLWFATAIHSRCRANRVIGSNKGRYQ
jgi:hypothetical protein